MDLGYINISVHIDTTDAYMYSIMVIYSNINDCSATTNTVYDHADIAHCI